MKINCYSIVINGYSVVIQLFLFLLLTLLAIYLIPSKAFAQEKLYFIHQDHLGSTSMVTDENGEVVYKQNYYPYGSTRNNQSTISNQQSTISRGYTSQISDLTQTGLYYYNARYYSPGIGIFTSADTQEGLNRYAYVGGNPIVFIDAKGQQRSRFQQIRASWESTKILASQNIVSYIETILNPSIDSIGNMMSVEQTKKFQQSNLYEEFFITNVDVEFLESITPIWLQSDVQVSKGDIMQLAKENREEFIKQNYLYPSAVARFLKGKSNDFLFGGFGISGNDLINVAEQYGINPIFLLSLAIEESGAGISNVGRQGNITAVGGLNGTSIDWQEDALANLYGAAYTLREYINSGMTLEEALSRYKSAGSQKSYDKFVARLMKIYKNLSVDFVLESEDFSTKGLDIFIEHHL